MKKNKTSMEKLTQGYEKFIHNKETTSNGKMVFEKAIKKTTTVKKQSGAK